MKRFLAVLLAVTMALSGSVVGFAAEFNDPQASEYVEKTADFDLELYAILDEKGNDVSDELRFHDDGAPYLEANKKYYFQIQLVGSDKDLEHLGGGHSPYSEEVIHGWVYSGEPASDPGDLYPFVDVGANFLMPYRKGDMIYMPIKTVFTSGKYGWSGGYRCTPVVATDDDHLVAKCFFFLVQYNGVGLVFDPAEKEMKVGETLSAQDILRDFPVNFYRSDKESNNGGEFPENQLPYEYLLKKYEDGEIEWSIGKTSVVKKTTEEGSNKTTFEAVGDGTTELTMTIRNFGDVPFADKQKYVPETVTGKLTLKVTDPNAAAEPEEKPAEKTEKPEETESSDNYDAQETAMDAVRAANDGRATAKVQNVATAGGDAVSAVSVKMYGASACLTIDNMKTLASGTTGLNVDLNNGAAQILIPAGFTMPGSAGVIAYPIGFLPDPVYSGLLKTQVKQSDASTEVYQVGGGELPTAATITIKTKVKGAVNIYCWDEDTRKISLVASASAENGKVAFSTKQLGNFIITTGTI